VAGELLEAGDVDAGGDAARDRPAPQAVPGERRAVEPGEAGPVLVDQRDRIGVDRVAAEAVARRRRFGLRALWPARRRQPPDPPEQRAIADRGAGEEMKPLPSNSPHC
jgi:hypothetical protein